MSREYGLQELVIDSSHDRVGYGFWCWKPADGNHAMYKSDSHYNNARLLRLSDNELAGHLVVVKKRDAGGHFHDYYYLRPVENATGSIYKSLINLTGHDHVGHLKWADASGSEYMSVSQAIDSRLYAVSNNMSFAGTLGHDTTEHQYYMNRTGCSNCAGNC
jgi:hypothetical protein